jgi:beta,beta-carotene 9',10'-dioxygenase
MKNFFIILIIACVGLSMFTIFKKRPSISTELREELVNSPLEIVGDVPSWLSGTLIRNGPIYVTIDGQTNTHWFDGLAMLHAFNIHDGKVDYTNKFLRTDAYKTVFEKGSLNYDGFAVDPCRSLFKRFFTLFVHPSKTELHNANVNVWKLADQYVALTEIPLPVKFDPQTLETLGVLDYQDQLPHGRCWESAHPHYDTARRETINYLIQYGRTSSYILYRLKDDSAQREIISQIPVQEPAYMHSFALTKNYAIFTEFPFVVKPLDFITKNQPFIKNFTWHPERGTQFTVVNRHNGEMIGKYTTKPFFAFHHANAFEEGDHIHLDIVCYNDPGVILEIANHFKSNLSENSPEQEEDIWLERFTLSLQTGTLSSEVITKQNVEFPRINEKFDGLPYRYVYLIDPSESVSKNDRRAIYKVDTLTKCVYQWVEEGCYPGEPVFVAFPDAKEEDEGVILTVVFDLGSNSSFLLILDGKSFEEIGRAKVTHAIPSGTHGQYFKK